MHDRKGAFSNDELADFSKIVASVASPGKGSDEHYHLLRRLGGLAYQARATSRAADHFISQESAGDQDTATWLVSLAVSLSDEIAVELDGMSKAIKERPPESGLAHPLQKVRVLAKQFFAASRAADHFLHQDNGEDKGTGSWLIACAAGLADKLADELEGLANNLKRPGMDSAHITDINPGTQRRSTTAGGGVKSSVV